MVRLALILFQQSGSQSRAEWFDQLVSRFALLALLNPQPGYYWASPVITAVQQRQDRLPGGLGAQHRG